MKWNESKKILFVMTALIFGVSGMACALLAAINGIAGWGWFLLIALIMGSMACSGISENELGENDED